MGKAKDIAKAKEIAKAKVRQLKGKAKESDGIALGDERRKEEGRRERMMAKEQEMAEKGKRLPPR